MKIGWNDKCVVIDYPKATWDKDLTPAEVPLFVDSLLANENYMEKVSHAFHGNSFQRAAGVIARIAKEKEKVIKVSKKQ